MVFFALIPLWRFSQEYQPAVGTNYGTKQYDCIKYITRILSIAAALLALIFYLPIITALKAILSMFITTLFMTEQGMETFRLLFISFILLGFWIVVLTLMQSLGRVTKASVSVILHQIVLYIPAAIVMLYVAGLRVHSIFIAPMVTDMIVLIVVIRMTVSKFKRMDGKP